MIKTVDPKSISVPELHSILLGTVIPRPIALASTIDKKGNINLSPFSFFNVFSANPPILIFSPARRVRDNTTKHTLENVKEVKEVCISVVTIDMVQQTSLASTEYDKGINEFVKAGFTELPSKRITPPRPKESPVSFECQIIEVKELGKDGGAGNLVICEILLIHLDESILNKTGKVDPLKLNSVARLGGNLYSKFNKESIFKVIKPLQTKGIGIDKLPEAIRNSSILTGSDLAILANIEELPIPGKLDTSLSIEEIEKLKKSSIDDRHKQARFYIRKGQPENAWSVLLQ